MKEKQICTHCGYIGYGIKKRAGITILEVILWVVPFIIFVFAQSASNEAYNLALKDTQNIYNWFTAGGYYSSSINNSQLTAYRQEATFLTVTGIILLIAALIYSIWRTKAGKFICPECKNVGMIPLDSPMGQKIYQELYKDNEKTDKHA